MTNHLFAFAQAVDTILSGLEKKNNSNYGNKSDFV